MAIGTAMRSSPLGDADDNMVDRPPTEDTLREMQELLRDSRPSMLVSGFTVAALTVGAGVEEAVVPTNLHAGAGTLLCLALLGVLALCLIRTTVLLIVAGRPLLDELGELRRRIGAPVEPNVPWTPVRTRTTVSHAPGWDRVREVTAAAHFRYVRAHQALTSATLAIIAFFGWTLVSLILAGRL